MISFFNSVWNFEFLNSSSFLKSVWNLEFLSSSSFLNSVYNLEFFNSSSFFFLKDLFKIFFLSVYEENWF